MGQPQTSAPAQPAWLQPLITVTTQLGVPTVIAGVLLWFVLARVDGTLKLIQEQEDARTKIMLTMQESMAAALDRLGTRVDDAIHENIKANQDLAARYAVRRPGAPDGP